MAVYTRDGFPWDPSRPAFHATPALRAIMHTALKPRKHVGRHVTGGGSELSVSLTLDARVAMAIALGIDVIRRIVQKKLGWLDLYERLRSECPKGAVEGLRYASYTEADLRHLNAGYRHFSFNDMWKVSETWLRCTTNPSHPSAKAPEWAFCSEGKWWGPAEKHPEEYVNKNAQTGADLVHFYRYTLPFAETAHEAYDPFFFMTDVEPFQTLAVEDIGVIETRVHLPRVCTDASGALQLGYLTRESASAHQHFLTDEWYSCERAVERHVEGDTSAYATMSTWGRPFKMDMWQIADEGRRHPETTMVYYSSMAELRVYDPSKIKIVSAVEIEELREERLGNRVTYPWFRVLEP